MPQIVDYRTVLQTLLSSGLQCTYHNSGSFAPQSSDAHIVGWTLSEDATIKESMRPHVRVLPSMSTLLDRFSRCSGDHLPGEVWIMPASHWAFEMNYGNAEWLPAALRAIGVNPELLVDRNDGSAIAFAATEGDALRQLVGELITRSTGSDFTAAWPGHCTVALLHHHRQVWWRTDDASLCNWFKNA